MPAQVLSGITILDLGRVLSAPYCGAILAEFGAQVIKIEKPGEGDETRDYSPKKNGESGYYITFNRGKKGITLDFKRGKKLFLNMIKNVDVVIENFRPGVMKRLGLDYNELKKVNSRLIYAAISGFGQTGPYASRAGYDTMAQAMSGLMSITGPVNGPPTRVGASVADVVAGLQAAIAILAALRYRDQTGKGQMIDIALVDSAVVCMAKHIQEFFTNNEIERHRNTRYGLTVPESLLKTNDGYIVLCGVPQTKWNELCELANKQALCDDYRFSSVEMRFRYQEQMDQLLEEWTIKLKTDDLIEILINNDFAAAPVLKLENVVDDIHIRIRRMFVDIIQPIAKNICITNSAIKMSKSSPSIQRHAPLLGEHNREIYSNLLRLSEKDIERLEEEGII